MNLMQDQNPGGHKEDRASFPNQIQYKVSKIHTPNPTLEKRKGGRKERKEEEGARREEEGGVLTRQKERARGRGGEGVFNPNYSQPKKLNYP